MSVTIENYHFLFVLRNGQYDRCYMSVLNTVDHFFERHDDPAQQRLASGEVTVATVADPEAVEDPGRPLYIPDHYESDSHREIPVEDGLGFLRQIPPAGRHFSVIDMDPCHVSRNSSSNVTSYPQGLNDELNIHAYLGDNSQLSESWRDGDNGISSHKSSDWYTPSKEFNNNGLGQEDNKLTSSSFHLLPEYIRKQSSGSSSDIWEEIKEGRDYVLFEEEQLSISRTSENKRVDVDVDTDDKGSTVVIHDDTVFANYEEIIGHQDFNVFTDQHVHVEAWLDDNFLGCPYPLTSNSEHDLIQGRRKRKRVEEEEEKWTGEVRRSKSDGHLVDRERKLVAKRRRLI